MKELRERERYARSKVAHQFVHGPFLPLSFPNNTLKRLPDRPGRIAIGLHLAGGAVLGAQPVKD